MDMKELNKMLEKLPEANKEQLELVAKGMLLAQKSQNGKHDENESGEYERKTPFAIMEMRSGNCMTKSKRRTSAMANDNKSLAHTNYRTLMLLDTGCYDMAPACAQARKIAETLGLELSLRQGTLHLIQELLTGPWTQERFIVAEPGEKLHTGIPG